MTECYTHLPVDARYCSTKVSYRKKPRCIVSGRKFWNFFKANLERAHIVCQFQQVKASRLKNVGSTHQ